MNREANTNNLLALKSKENFCSARAVHRGLSAHNEPHRRAGKGRFLNVIFYHIELRKLQNTIRNILKYNLL